MDLVVTGARIPILMPQMSNGSWCMSEYDWARTSGTVGTRFATWGDACWRRKLIIWSAVRPQDRAPVTLSRVSVPTKRLGSMHSQRINRRRIAYCRGELVYAYTCTAFQSCYETTQASHIVGESSCTHISARQSTEIAKTHETKDKGGGSWCTHVPAQQSTRLLNR
jgi:hypothetical protein